MYKPVDLLAIITTKSGITGYMYQKTEKIILPIKVSAKIKQPNIYDTIKRTAAAFGAKPALVKISMCENQSYYTYLTIFRGNTSLDINIDLLDAIGISKELELPILINERILSQQGILVTKQMIESSLRT